MCIPHWYVAFSLVTRMTVANGGDEVAEIGAGLLIPMCLADAREWHWLQPLSPMLPTWRGSSLAAHLILRAQVALIYFASAVSKVAYPAWRHGSALGMIFEHPQYGLPDWLRSLTAPLAAQPWVLVLATWGVIALEIGIAAAMLCNSRVRRWALMAGILLHTAIAITMGLFSFGPIMIGILSIAAGGTRSAVDEDFFHSAQATLAEIETDQDSCTPVSSPSSPRTPASRI